MELGERLSFLLMRLLQIIVCILIAALTATVVAGVIYRKMEWTLEWYDEVASVILAWLTYYGAALVALRRGHISVPGLVRVLPKPGRIAALICSEIIVIGFFAILGWQGYQVLDLLGTMGMTSLPRVPIQFTQSVIPIGATIFILAELLSFKQAWQQATDDGRGKP